MTTAFDRLKASLAADPLPHHPAFVCVDCDCDVYVSGYCPPEQTRCGLCQWIADLPEEADRERLRVWLKHNPGYARGRP